MDWALVSVGAVVGALARHQVSRWEVSKGFQPWGIAAVNFAGSFILGGLSATDKVSPSMKTMVGVGFCGSFTTFSTYAVFANNLLVKEKMAMFVAYTVTTNVGGILSAAAAMRIFGRFKEILD